MNPNNGQSPRRPRGRSAKNTYTTKSGTEIKLNRSFSERRRAQKDALARQRAARLSALPTNKFKRVMYSLHPKRVVQYWFSREGAIMALKITGVGMVVCFLLLVGLFAYFRKDLPKVSDVESNTDGSVTYYDRTGQTVLWQDYNAIKRVPVTGDKISDYVKEATIAIEDKDFYKQGAFNVRGIARAAVHDLTNRGQPIQGGSTITQQLVKLNGNWTNDRTITRKIKELILAVEMERSYSKEDILTGYLNMAPYGGIQVGVQSASKDFFNKDAKDLTIAEASFLASIPQSPDTYYPFSPNFEKDKLVGRQHYVLDRMVEQGYITKQESEEAKKDDVSARVQPLQPKYSNIKAPYYVLAAKSELESTYLSESTKLGGWKVNTALDLDLQNKAEEQVKNGMAQIKRQGGDSAAFVAEDVKTGEIVAAVGGADFENDGFGKLNFAHSVQVSPGSTFKPYDYVAMIDKSTNVGAGSVLYDQKGELPGYPCTNKQLPKDGGNCLHDYDFRFPGPVTLRYALGGSRNVPAVKAMLTVGTDKTISIANGLMAKENAYKCYAPGTDVFSANDKTDQAQCYGSSAIGDGAYLHLDDHVNGIASLARLGSAMSKTYIHGITDSKGKKVELKKREAKQVVRPDSAYIVNDMAADQKASYLNGLNNCAGPCYFHNYKGWKFAIKTGTTNDGYDGLMASWSGRYATMTWVGYHTRTKEMSGSMERMTAPIARNWMQAAHDKLDKVENWTQPEGMKTLPAYVIRSKLSSLGESIPSPSTDLFPSWYTSRNTNTGTAVIDRVSGKLATDCTPESAKQSVGNSNANSFAVDQFVNGRGAAASNTTTPDDIHNCNDAKPTINLTIASTSGGNQTNICDKDGCTITATVSQGTHPLASGRFPGKLTISVNGNTVQTFNIAGTGSPQTFSATYRPDGSGSANVTASVTDSVLYNGDASQSVTLSNTSGSNEENQPQTGPGNRSGNRFP